MSVLGKICSRQADELAQLFPRKWHDHRIYRAEEYKKGEDEAVKDDE